jgi:Flp pilus assembly protein TadD
VHVTHNIQLLWLRCKASVLLFAGQPALALHTFETMEALAPADIYPLSSQAQIHAQQGRLDQALDLQHRITHLAPQQAAAWYNLGFMLEQASQLDDAESAFRRAVDLSPQLDRAWYGLGLVLIRLRRFDDAVDALRKNTQLQPMSPYGWYQLARVHADRNEPHEAMKIIHHLQGFEPKIAAQLERETGLRAAQPG